MPEEKQAVWAKGLPEVPKAMLWPCILGGSGESVYVHSDESLMDDGDDERRKDVENFILLHDTEWADKISSHARQTIAERKYNESDILPLTCDIVKLKDFLLHEIVRLSELLLKDINAVNWRNLAVVVLCRITIFNKRRGGETSQMKLSAYVNRKTGEWKDAENLEIISTLSPIEKKLMDRLQLVEIVGKKNRKVPVLLTKDMWNALDLLNSKRNAIGVPLQNPFLFAAPSSKSGHLKCWDSLKWITNRVDLKNPELITTTNMRKYIATVSQIVDLDSKNELEWLANHMGHTLSVHRKYYRLQEQTLELAKVSKLLIAADCGIIHRYAGKTLDDITLEEIQLDKSEEEDCDEQDCSSSEECQERTPPKIKDSKQKQKEQKQSEKDTEYVCSNAKKCTRRPWKEEDKQALRTSFHQHFTLCCPPSKSDVMLQGRKSDRVRKLIEERGWKAVKYYVWNLVQQHKKRGQNMTNAKEQKN